MITYILDFIVTVMCNVSISEQLTEPVCTEGSEPVVPQSHVLCGVRGRPPSHTRPLLATTEGLPQVTLPPQQLTVSVASNSLPSEVFSFYSQAYLRHNSI